MLRLPGSVRDALLTARAFWLHTQGDASKMIEVLVNLIHRWVSASQLSPLVGPDWGFKPHPQSAAAYTSMSLLSSFLLPTRDTRAAVKMQGESLCAKLCCCLSSKVW